MYRAAGHDKGSGAFSCLSCTVTIRTWSEGKWLKHSPLINKQHASQNNQHVFRCLRNVTSFFFSSLFVCPPVCWCVSGISPSPSLPLSRSLKTSHPPPLLVPPRFFTRSHRFIGREPRVETAHWARSTLECCWKALQHVRMARERTLPYWHTFYANELPGLGDKAAGKRGGGSKRSHSCIPLLDFDENETTGWSFLCRCQWQCEL